jgi:hypothetical protein
LVILIHSPSGDIILKARGVSGKPTVVCIREYGKW